MKHVNSRIGLSLLGVATAVAFTGVVVDGIGCSVAEPTALFLGVSSDMRVADDFDSVGLFISVNGEVKYQGVHPVSPTGEVLLPASLSVLQPDEPSTPVHIRVVGYKSSQVIAVRDAVTTIPSNQISVLRLPVQWLSTGATKGQAAGAPASASTTSVSLAGVKPLSSLPADDTSFSEFAPFFTGLALPCPTGQTAIAGTCESVMVPPSALVPTKAGGHVGEVYGGATGLDEQGRAPDGACFAVEDCFAESEAVRPEDVLVRRDGSAILGCEIPKPRGGAVAELNVAIDRDGTPGAYVALNSEAATEANEGGWRETSTAIALPPAVCARLGTTARGLRVSTRCSAKRAKDPTCGPWSAVKNAAKPGFSPGRYYAGSSPSDAGPDGCVGLGCGPTDADADASTWETPTLVAPLGDGSAPTRMAFDNDILWITGRQGTVKITSGASARVLALATPGSCTFGYVAARNGLGAIACHGNSSTSWYARVETDGSVNSHSATATVGGAAIIDSTPVIGSQEGNSDATSLIRLDPGSNDVPVALQHGDGGTWVGGISDLFYRPGAAVGLPGTLFFTTGSRVYSVINDLATTLVVPTLVAEMPSPLDATFTADALVVYGSSLYFYGTNGAKTSPQQGEIFRSALATPGPALGLTGGFAMSTENPGTDKPALAVDDTGIYWSDGDGVFWLPLAAIPGTKRYRINALAKSHTYGLALSPSHVYWAESAPDGKASLYRATKARPSPP